MTLCVYTKNILERINNEVLHDENTPFVKVLDGTVGSYLCNDGNKFLNTFLVLAEGVYLDMFGDMFGLKRREGESDNDFRQRIITDETMIECTDDFLKLDIGMWVHLRGVIENKDILTSRNTYLKKYHESIYVFIVSGNDKEYIEKKFLLNDILFIE